MALVRFGGGQVRCTLVSQNEHGSWLCRSLQHAPRLSVGTHFRVSSGDVIQKDEVDDLPAIAAASKSSLEADMAAERETLPTVKQVLKDNPPIAHDAPGKV